MDGGRLRRACGLAAWIGRDALAALVALAAVAALALPCAILCAGCGANIQAVYEGDVRFEHCMSLDVRPGVRSAIRRACWAEWLRFYTYGQTRDRVAHGQARVRQLDGPEPDLAPDVLPPRPGSEDDAADETPVDAGAAPASDAAR